MVTIMSVLLIIYLSISIFISVSSCLVYVIDYRRLPFSTFLSCVGFGFALFYMIAFLGIMVYILDIIDERRDRKRGMGR